MRARCFAAVLAALLVGPAAAQGTDPRNDQEQAGPALSDHGYRFSLRAPAGWRLQGETEIGKINASAQAGLMSRQGKILAVLVEQAPVDDLVLLTDAVVEGIAVHEKQILRVEAVDYCGLPARQFALRGTIQGTDVIFVGRMFLRAGYVYQVIGWGSTLFARSIDDFEEGFAGFGLLEDETVRPRRREHSLADAEGLGWRLRDGAYESVVPGLRLSPPPRWRLVVGAELDGMNTEAHVGMVQGDGQAFMVVISERVSGVDEERFSRFLRTRFRENSLGASRVVGEPLAIPVGEATLDAVLLDVEHAGMTLRFAHGMLYHRGFANQVLVWWLRDDGQTAASERVRDALAGLELLADDALEALQAETRATPLSEEYVAPDCAIRGGVYTDFRHDFTWTRPADAMWRMTCGDTIQAGGARLELEEIEQGLFGTLAVGPARAASAAALHAQHRGTLVAPDDPQLEAPPDELQLGEHVLLVSSLDFEHQGETMTRVLATGLVGRREVVFELWGYAGNVALAPDAALRAVRGLELADADLTPTEIVDDGAEFRERRLGFRLRRPAPGWRFEDATPAQIGFGSIVLCVDPSQRYGVQVVAICAIEPGQDASWFEDAIVAGVLDDLGDRMGVRFEAPRPVVLEDQPCLLRSGRSPQGGSIHCYVFSRGRRLIGLFTWDEDGNGPPQSELRKCFESD